MSSWIASIARLDLKLFRWLLLTNISSLWVLFQYLIVARFISLLNRWINFTLPERRHSIFIFSGFISLNKSILSLMIVTFNLLSSLMLRGLLFIKISVDEKWPLQVLTVPTYKNYRGTCPCVCVVNLHWSANLSWVSSFRAPVALEIFSWTIFPYMVCCLATPSTSISSASLLFCWWLVIFSVISVFLGIPIILNLVLTVNDNARFRLSFYHMLVCP